MSALTSDAMIGLVIDGRYEVVRRIARGGMATVYLARDRRLQRRVALKIMHPHLGDGVDVTARFRREARAAARLAHPGIVAVLDQGIDGETSYLAMEYVAGRTLRTEIAGRGALSIGQSLAVTESVLDALAAAHRAHLVHRDVKPENVLLTRDGLAKVGDFGLARAVTEATAATTGTLLGTVAYLAPEIVTDGVADARADVYAVGIMLYEMITGHTPFDGPTPIRVAYRHVHEDVPAPSAEISWLPHEIDALVATMTARDPDSRPADGAAALEMVRQVAGELDERAFSLRADVPGRPELLECADEGEETMPIALDDPQDAESPSPGEETARLDARTAGPSTGTVSLPIGAVTREVPRTQETTPRPRRRRVWTTIGILLVLALGSGAAWYFLMGPGARTTVPVLAGMSRQEALEALESASLRGEFTTAYDDVVPADEVIALDPRAGTVVPHDTLVAVTVSLGVEMIDVVDVAGQGVADARESLQAAGLTAGTTQEVADRTVPAGTVIRTEPGAGQSIPHDQEVTLVVSSGPEMITIRDYAGQPAETAREDLAAALDVELEDVTLAQEFSDEIPQGAVIRSEPEAGSRLPQGSEATLVVSQGPELFEVPGVVGDQVDSAQAELESLGFVVEVERVLGGFFGTVRSQSVEAGEMVPAGTLITLTVV
ncbi:Stk1 family PASTA domain-containing Ser/Thr kinase [Serinibacter salmoneus]|uniref:non-specific serine/threonine protein kinase n=1 Tax=Serinibacter salmoneus TaxID=556530 RepID=A0A2A9D0Z8_9MICO|nr:Stk1 family PASTA domain-containing Ser/Thr kinase [Serinibacter salmoneus]PFG19520.1 serine/threonine-protein kinase [Serinibacter salmoneus]